MARRRIVRLFLALTIAVVALASRSARADESTVEPTRIGAFVASLADISEAQRRFDITFWVWMLSAPASSGTDPAKTLEIMNAATTERQHSVTTETPQGRWSQVKFRAAVRNPLDFRHFPFDRHTLEIHLEDAERDVRTLQFVADTPINGRPPLVVSSDLDPPEWEIGDVSLTTSVHVDPTNYGDPSHAGDSEFSRATLRIDIARRHSLRILLTLLLGTFLGTMVAFFAALLPIQQSPPRYTLVAGSLFVCIANRLLVDARLPPGSSLGLLDQMQLVAILGLIVLAGVSLWLTNLADTRVSAERGTRLSQRFGVAWLATVAAIQIGLVLVHSA